MVLEKPCLRCQMGMCHRCTQHMGDECSCRSVNHHGLFDDDKPALFQQGKFTLHSGEESNFKIECDSLTDEDIVTIALLIAERIPPFSSVIGIPEGGLRLAQAMRKYGTPSEGKPLVVDDVLTTGRSFMDYEGKGWQGAVIFARTGNIPDWIYALFRME